MQNNEKEAIGLLQALLSNKNKKQNDSVLSPGDFDLLRNAIISEGARVSRYEHARQLYLNRLNQL